MFQGDGEDKIIGHAKEGISAYFPDCTQLRFMPLLFVGRTEHLKTDWARFLNLYHTTGVLPSTHHFPKQGVALSAESIAFLRRYVCVCAEVRLWCPVCEDVCVGATIL